jgi:hypothetical protein
VSRPDFEFSAELLDYEPKIWRRFQISGVASMARLGYALMVMFEMQASHLFRLEVPVEKNRIRFLEATLSGKDYEIFKELERGEPNDSELVFEVISEDTYDFCDQDDDIYDARDSTIKSLVSQRGDEIKFWYDYGDSWHVLCKLERVIKDAAISGRILPRVLEGEGFGIVENCGGVDGLAELAKDFCKLRGAERDKLRDCLGTDDLAMFDLDDMNYRLLKIPRIYADIYECDLEPSARSLAILERRYLKR